MSPPRLFGIPASEAPVVAVLRRGPSAWSHVGRWDVATGDYEPGAWIRGNLYPQRCDVSPDGRWLCYFTLRGSANWSLGTTYLAVSRLPWLTALVAWSTCGTWTRGAHFVSEPRRHELSSPEHGDARELTRRYGLVVNRAATFAVERRRGWSETPETPARQPDDMWDEWRAEHVVMRKPRPGRPGLELTVNGYFAAFREGPFRDQPRVTRYALVSEDGARVLDDVQWADWDREGRLLVATMDGRLQIRAEQNDGFVPVHEVDLAALRPEPAPPPREAARW